ncbi:hypothetical protein QUC32_21865 [Novosphingobium resinovorum]|uniref:hypothetical protein n=1 Tax=Novosphingobium TaxID=165696 RepID=UPI001B3CA18A|nr:MULTISPECIES: hypothetical protein [Novosphingobium]MBF7012298.1 hypothetical protein [Novosphingobium sp. HR1a]WJM27040.1 hypothetical protein QUC32_21865 [Novosphingobium resinovorum]
MGSLSLAIAFFAALGIGSIVAAAISRWNSISQLRQAWVDALRKDIAEFFHCVEKFGASASAKDTETKNKLRERRDSAMAVYRQIVLRLNFKEIDHRRLDKALKDVLLIQSTIDDRKMTKCLILSRKVLKQEWDRTKFGPFLSIYYKIKTSRRRRRLLKARKARAKSLTRRSAG